MSRLDGLPNELIHEIAAYRTSIVSLSQVSKRIHSVVEVILYSQVSLVSASRSELRRMTLHSDGPPSRRPESDYLHRFLRTILENPSLGSHVVTLEIGEALSEVRVFKDIDEVDQHETSAKHKCKIMSCHCPQSRWTRYNISPAEKNWFDSTLAAAREKGMTEGFMHHSACAGEVVLLLHHLPKLQTLRFALRYNIPLSVGNFYVPLAAATLGRLKGGAPSGLLSLRELSTSYNSTISRSALLALMTLPNLRVVTATPNIMFEKGLDTTLWGGKASYFKYMSEVSNLSLQLSAGFNTQEILWILQTPALESLQTLALRAEGASFEQIYTVVRENTPSLTTLSLSFKELVRSGAIMNPNPPLPFTTFNRLLHLALSINALFGTAPEHSQEYEDVSALETDFNRGTRSPIVSSLPLLHGLLPHTLLTLEISTTPSWDIAFLCLSQVLAGWDSKDRFPALEGVTIRNVIQQGGSCWGLGTVISQIAVEVAVQRLQVQGFLVLASL